MRGGFDLLGFDMGGCFPCFGSSDKEDNSTAVKKKKKEVVANKDSSFKEASLPHPSRVSSGQPPNFETFFLKLILPSLFDYWVAFNYVQFPLFLTFCDPIFQPKLLVDLIWFI